MRKTFLPLYLLLFSVITFSQNVFKAATAGFIFEELYGDNYNIDENPAIDFSNPFVDLQDNNIVFQKIRILSHLDYGDGIAPFLLTNNTAAFYPFANTTRGEALVAIMEAWDIPISTSGSSPFDDIDKNSPFFGYAKKAVDLGIISSSSSDFNITEEITESTLVRWVNNVKNSSFHPVSETTLNRKSNYFEPNTFNPYNIGVTRGVEQAVFSHYAKNSFVIPDRKLNLNFSHYYSTQMVELPQTYFPIKPLGRGWTHTYNSYITLEYNVIDERDEVYTIVWPDGSTHLYNQDEEKYITKGVYDEFDEDRSDRIYITKKNQVRYKYERLDNDRDIFYLTEIRDPNGNSIDIEYESAEEDNTERIETVIAPSGKKLEFKYRSNTDLVERIEDPIGRKIFFDYNEGTSGWKYRYPVLREFEDAKGNFTAYDYGTNNDFDAHLLKSIRLPEGNRIEAEYDNDNNGKLESYKINDNDEIVIETDFDFSSDTPLHSEITIPMPDGGTQKFDYEYNRDGVLTHYESDTDDVTVKYPTSATSKVPLLPTETTTNGLKIEYDYDNDGNVEKIDVEDGKVIEEFKYDSNNNLTQHTDPEGNITKFSYDNDENLTQIEDALGKTINYTYDRYGQLLSVINQEGIAINYTYEEDGAVATISAPEGIESSFDYDGINRLLSKRVNGLTSSYNYDDNDNVTSFTNTGGFTTSYDYDKNDNTVSITNTKGIATVFEYNDKDQLTSETFGNLEKKYRYNDDGSLERFTKPSGNRINYEYDNDGRLKEFGTISNIEYDSRNLVDEITNDAGKMEFKYDDLNRLDEVTTVYEHKIEYDYEKTGLIEEIEYPIINGIELKVYYNYDDKNRISEIGLIRNVGEIINTIAEYKYFKDDRLQHIDFEHNVRSTYDYDDAGRLNYIEHSNNTSGVSFYFANLTLDNRGNITQEQANFPSIGSGWGINPSSKTNGGKHLLSAKSGYSYNDNNHAEEVDGISHNVNDDGNTTAISSNITFEYDVHDRLARYQDDNTAFNYKYNAYGQRVEQVKNGVSKKYIRDVRTDNVLISLDQNDNPIYYYIYAPSGTLIARMNPQGDLFYYYADIRGSTVAITNEEREVTHQYRYSDYGTITNSLEPDDDFNPYRYVGTYGVETDDFDLYYMRARYYTPSTGRFLTEDPVWSTNLYPYADNNPISRVDPKGTLAFAVPALYTGSTAIVNTAAAATVITGISVFAEDIVESYASLISKMNAEINRIKEKELKRDGITYQLQIRKSGNYLDVRGNIVYLEAGDVWKYGETTTKRYSRSTLDRLIPGGVDLVPVYTGTQGGAKITEKILIYSYFFERGKLPPGNKIFR